MLCVYKKGNKTDARPDITEGVCLCLPIPQFALEP